MSEEKVEISKISLEIEGQKISVTLDGARKLKNILNDLFGKEVQVIERNNYYPFYWSRTRPHDFWNDGIIYCGDTNEKVPYASFGINANQLDVKL